MTSFYLSKIRSSVNTRICRRALHQLPLKQGDNLFIELDNIAQSLIDISSKWQDHCDVDFLKSELYDMKVLDTSSPNDHHIILSSVNQLIQTTSVTPLNISFIVPEYVNIKVDTDFDLKLKLRNKIQGDCSVRCQSGLVSIDKLRGEFLEFDCGIGDIVINKMVEGNSHFKCHSLAGRMINGDSVSILGSGDVKVDAVYSAEANIRTDANIELKLLSGSLQARSSGGNITVKGIDGSFDLLADRGTIRLEVNKLFPHTTSLAHAVKGNIVATADPELQATVLCESESYRTTRAAVTIISDAFIPSSSSSSHNSGDAYHTQDAPIPVESEPESIKLSLRAGRVAGRLTGKSDSLKRPVFDRVGSSNSGKIDVNGAAAQALQSWSERKSNSGGIESGHTSGQIAQRDETNTEKNDDHFDLVLTARGNIRLETMSWIEAVRRKYGFTDETQGTMPSGRPGRIASAGSKAAKIKPALKEEDQ